MHDEPLPPVPAHRAITPAPQDYRQRITFRQALWPVLWIAGCVALAFFLRAQGWPAFRGGGH